MKETKIETLKKYYVYFMLYSIIGWFYEVFLETIVYRWGFRNRGVLYGPYCPIYGVGAILFLVTVYKLIIEKEKKQRILLIPLVFLSCGLIATIVELVSTYIFEYFTGAWPWQTYVNYRVNFEGRIALSTSIRFGLGGLLFLYILQPQFEKLVKSVKRLNILFYSLFIIVTVDIIISLII